MADDGNRSLWVKQTETGNTLQIVPPTKGNILKRTGEPRQLTDFTFNFTSNYIFRHAWSHDGRTLALVRGRGTSDVVLLRDER